jgi:hypothetical protein
MIIELREIHPTTLRILQDLRKVAKGLARQLERSMSSRHSAFLRVSTGNPINPLRMQLIY